MKSIRFDISLYIIIPVIFSGIALLSIIVAYHLTHYYMGKGMAPEWPLVIFGICMMVLTFGCSLVIAKTLLGPMERFVSKTESLGVLKNIAADPDHKAVKRDDISRFALVFDQVTELLSRVDSLKLFPKIAGQSKAMRGVFNQIVKVAATDSTIMIFGETGTGKELVAKSIHEHSQRQGKSFVAINCAAIPDGLLESELFGHEKGAFTGANDKKPGKFEIADDGTIFMDEIGDMPLATQAKLLRVIQESQIERVGGIRPINVNVRFIAATNKNLSKMVEAGEFRDDLFFRLNVFSIQLPPLRERREDIPALVDNFLNKLGKNLSVSSDAMEIITSYKWPGNVRELQNVVEAASVLAKEDVIESFHLPPFITKEWRHTEPDNPDDSENQSLDHRLQSLEKGMIIEALRKAGGFQVKAANLLGIKEKSLRYRVKKLNIDVSSFKWKNFT
jgi:transcriptional regulator with GAF, ATPase, and Fis domain